MYLTKIGKPSVSNPISAMEIDLGPVPFSQGRLRDNYVHSGCPEEGRKINEIDGSSFLPQGIFEGISEWAVTSEIYFQHSRTI